MQFVELPTIDEEGAVTGSVKFSPEEVKTLIQFAVNFLGSLGHTAAIAVGTQQEGDHPLND